MHPLESVALSRRTPKSDIECRSSCCITVRMPKLEFHEVDAARWGDFERLFESRGGPKSCWCMVWRAGAKTNKGVDRKFGIRRYVSNETPIGLLGYSEGEPVAWCSIAPRPTYRDLGGPNRAGELPEQVWSLACFFIRRDLRGQGLTKQIIEAAVQHAEKRGDARRIRVAPARARAGQARRPPFRPHLKVPNPQRIVS